jgi:hypothetical protein
MKYQVKSIDYQDCKEWFLKKHYAKRMPSVSFCFGLYSDKLEGVCSYGKPASPNLCESICGAEHKEMVYELNRLVSISSIDFDIINENNPINISPNQLKFTTDVDKTFYYNDVTSGEEIGIIGPFGYKFMYNLSGTKWYRIQ